MISRKQEGRQMKLIRYLAWAWIIVIGALMFTPARVLCIKCGLTITAPGYIGDTSVTILAAGAIVLGLVGIFTEGSAGAAAKAAGAGK
jgi:hypothetical protein